MTMGSTAARCPALLVLYFVCMGIWVPNSALQILDMKTNGTLGGTADISCVVDSPEANITWLFQEKPIESGGRIKIAEGQGRIEEPSNILNIKTSNMSISNVSREDAGDYVCRATLDQVVEVTRLLNLSFSGRLLEKNDTIYVNASDAPTVILTCVFEVYNTSIVKWSNKGQEGTADDHKPIINGKRLISHYNKTIHKGNDTGTYVCEAEDAVTNTVISGSTDIIVHDKPDVSLNEATAINTTEVFIKWTVNAYHCDITGYHLKKKMKTESEFTNLSTRIPLNNTSYVVHDLVKSTEYQLMLEVKTTYGNGFSNVISVKTLDEEPVFVPQISINGFSATSVTIGWAEPRDEIKQFIHYYILKAKKKDGTDKMKAYHPRDERNLPYMFDNLEPHSTYIFQVCACSDYGTERCGDWSKQMEAATLDGQPTEPTNVSAQCGVSHMNLTWGPPLKPNAEIKGYTMELRGEATYVDRFGNLKNSTWGPLSKFSTNDSVFARFDDLQPNTRYSVHISAMTRTRRRGGEGRTGCVTEPAPPDQLPRPRWGKILEQDKYLFKMTLPRISERNGPLCCYKVYMVRLRDYSDWKNLPSAKSLKVIKYKEAHAESPVLGAYLTDVFSNKGFPSASELVMGDSKSYINVSDTAFKSETCRRCLPGYTVTTTTTHPTTIITTTVADADISTDDGLDLEPPNDTPAPKTVSPTVEIKPEDGPLDSTANYTLFVEVISNISDAEPLYSNYVNFLMPAPTPVAPQPATPVEIALQVTCAVAALVLLLMIIFCIRQTRRSRKMPPHAHLELNPLQLAYRYITGLGGRPQMVPSVPPNMPPIAKEDLAAAYAEKQADSDYGFQKEFELLQILPECFPDRTTHASEARENQPKNRYPDIKAYDQTRVKLSQIDSITGSDYINANYVMGYQERKQFICAQGPTDTTVNDFWRMIWEHGLELIVMLTNLEEYSKVKCSKYWPDEVRGGRAFGNIHVQHVAERRYSDYIVRELKISKQPTTSDGQPIVENNGIAKRNGDCKEAADGSVPTSPRELKDADTRIVKQYHFLMWKDFAAPEHAYSILKFIKRVNEAWSSTVVRPCVVHCSAGVGRTGTLVALDYLLEQLRAEGQAAVFNTVAELRRQRNFLVQSLKQYVFVYRALVEYAHYGDTEIPACRLKTTIDRLRNTPPGGTACLMELEFEKILNSPIPDPLKSCAAGAAEELRSKNRSQEILPYDRNRVILAPIATRDYSTYINASFIEAYDNSESFIITQDPLPSTITDFWRMVSEHNVATIVMLSEMGDGKCPRYWDDGTATYDHISVQYEESESCPYYTRRQFRLNNNKVDSGTPQPVRALQYQGWPTAVGAVPEVTRGLAELADAAASPPGTMLVHCQLGTERSALFVALCILICQLRSERRVDVCCVARKVRSQRARTIDTFSHYEFLHRAILNYAELHNLLEDS